MQFIDGKTYDIYDGSNTIKMTYCENHGVFYAQRGFLAGYLDIEHLSGTKALELIEAGYITVKESE